MLITLQVNNWTSLPVPFLTADFGSHCGTWVAIASIAWPAAIRVSQLLLVRYTCTWSGDRTSGTNSNSYGTNRLAKIKVTPLCLLDHSLVKLWTNFWTRSLINDNLAVPHVCRTFERRLLNSCGYSFCTCPSCSAAVFRTDGVEPVSSSKNNLSSLKGKAQAGTYRCKLMQDTVPLQKSQPP